MAMVPSLRRNLWNWLPTFLEVAETGSVVAASRRLHLTPAAVSRTLRLLEETLTVPLFHRVGRGLALNGAGATLRDATRGAVREVERGLAETLGDPFQGPLRVASLGVLTDHFVVPALIDLKRAHPGLAPEHVNAGPAEATALLRRGTLDVAFYYEDLAADGVAVERLGHTSAAVYCGRGHPLFTARRVTAGDVRGHPFSIPQIGDSGRVQDGWPPDRERTVGMRITTLRSNLLVALSGTLLTVLPEVTAAPHLARHELRRLPGAVPVIDVFAARDRATLGRGTGQLIVDAVRARLQARPGRRLPTPSIT